MKFNPIIIVSGEPYSIFLELFFKVYSSKLIKTYNRPLILVASKKLILNQMKILGYKFNINLINQNMLNKKILDNQKINLIDVNFNYKNKNNKISFKSKKYINTCFDLALKLMKNKIGFALINGPISKKHFLKKKFLGITEYLAHKTNTKNNEVMLIYNEKISVCPITTHLPLKEVNKKIKTGMIVKKIKLINSFYKKYLNKKTKFAVCGLNPHCETINKFSEEDKIIKPAIKILKRNKINIEGPLSADTLFMKKNIKKYDVFIGMYHDQVLGPIKALFGFNSINITLGLPFIRISPDHGPNNSMFGKNKSNPKSLIESLSFLKKIRAN